jgi:phage shock protein A
MESEARSMRSYLAEAVVNLHKLEKDHDQHATAARDYEQKARIILSDGDESNDYLAKEALLRKKENEGLAAQFKAAAEKQKEGVDSIKRNMTKMEQKIAEAKSKKRMLMAKSQIAQTQQKIIAATNATAGSNNAFSEMKRIEEKIDDQVQRAEVEAQIAGQSSVDQQLEEISFGSEVDRELEAMKQSIALEGGEKRKELPGA